VFDRPLAGCGVRIRTRTRSALQKKAKRGFRGYPIATVAFYGPTGELATKVAVAIVLAEGQEPSELKRWFSEDTDIREDADVQAEILKFVTEQGAMSVVMTDGLLGCPHEEGIDYPEGGSCPKCPYWAGRDRFSKQRLH
jgi:hypothetical protein